MIFNKARGLQLFLAGDTPSLMAGGNADLRFAFTTAANPQWSAAADAGFTGALVADTFGGKTATISASGFNIGGDDKYDLCMGDKTLVATGGQTQFQYAWLWEATSGLLLGYWDFGQLTTVLDGQALFMELNDANDRFLSLP